MTFGCCYDWICWQILDLGHIGLKRLILLGYFAIVSDYQGQIGCFRSQCARTCTSQIQDGRCRICLFMKMYSSNLLPVLCREHRSAFLQVRPLFHLLEIFEPRTPPGPPPMTPPFFVPRTPSELFECPGTPESVWCVHMSENWMHVYFQRHIVWHFVLPYSAMFDRVWWCETLARNWRCKFSMVQLLPALA